MFTINKDDLQKRSYGLQSIDQKLTGLLNPLFQGSKKEFLIINNLVKNWEEIVGKKYAKLCYPKSINFSKNKNSNSSQAKLTIAVYNSSTGFLLENNSDFLLEKIASLYGFKAVYKIIIRQEPQAPTQGEKDDARLSKSAEENLQNTLSNISDQDLAKTLARLGREILGDKDY